MLPPPLCSCTDGRTDFISVFCRKLEIIRRIFAAAPAAVIVAGVSSGMHAAVSGGLDRLVSGGLGARGLYFVDPAVVSF